MNILHLNDKIEVSGGVEVNINNIIKYLREESIESFWIGIYTSKEYFLKIFNHEDKVLTDSLENTVQYLKEYIFNHNIDLIHIHSISDPALIGEIVKMAPVVKSMRDPRMFCPGHGKFWRKSEEVCTIKYGMHCFVHAYTQGCMNSRFPSKVLKSYKNTEAEIKFSKKDYRAVIVMSDYMLKESVKAGIPEHKLKLNPHLTNIIEGDKLKKDVFEKKRIIFVGRLSRTKGVHYFIKVALQILESNKEVMFDIVGDGHDRGMFEEMIPQKLKACFIFHGWKTNQEISSLLLESYLMIFPSIYPEAFGISGIEAMMHGKPVVGFDVGGVSTWLKHGKTGYLVPAKNVDKMSERVQLLLDDKQQYLKISRNARQVALEEFSPEVHIKKLKEIYVEALHS